MSQNVPVWLVAYTLPRAEKKASEKLQKMGINDFLPLYETYKVWSDRKKKVQVPLFPNYLFLQTTLYRRFELLQIKELLHYVSFGGEVVQVREKDIETIRQAAKGINGEVAVVNDEFQQKGLPVIVSQGPMTGLRGTVEQSRGRKRLLIKVQSLRQVISLEVTADMLVRDDDSAHLQDLYPRPAFIQ